MKMSVKNVFELRTRLPVTAAVLVVSLIFILFLKQQNISLNPTNSLHELKNRNVILPLEDWSLSIFQCAQNEPQACAQVIEPKEWTIPNQKPPVTQEDGFLTKAVIQATLTPEQSAWIMEHQVVSVAVHRSVHNHVKLIEPKFSDTSIGIGTPASFFINHLDIENTRKITLEFDITGLPWFGPAELPISLVLPDTLYEYHSLSTKQVLSGKLSQQLGIAFPLMLAAMAIILDHSGSFRQLAYFATAYAMRSFLPSTWEDSGQTSNLMLVLLSLTNAFVLLLGLNFIAKISNIIYSKSIRTISTLGLVLLSIFIGVFSKESILRLDVYTDAVLAATALVILIYGMTHIKHTEQTFGLERSLVYARFLLLMATFLFYIQPSLNNIFQFSQSAFKDMIDFRTVLFFPALTAATLIETGSVTKKITRAAKTLSEKAMQDRDLKLGAEVQQRMLPKAKDQGKFYEWRSFYKPATALAGDWFDVREIVIRENYYLVGCVADVTGHGVGASLTTSVISSAWGAWCQRLQKQPHGIKEDPKILLNQIITNINEAMLGLRQNERATLICFMLDLGNYKLTYANAGHPGFYSQLENTVLYHFQGSGGVLGQHPDTPIECYEVQLSGQELLCFFSDGVLPSGLSASQWSVKMNRSLKKSPALLSQIIVSQAVQNRRLFLQNPETADDITALVIKLKYVDS